VRPSSRFTCHIAAHLRNFRAAGIRAARMLAIRIALGEREVRLRIDLEGPKNPPGLRFAHLILEVLRGHLHHIPI